MNTIDWNTPEAMQEYNAGFLEESAKNLHVRITKVETVENSQKPCVRITYKVLEGEHEDKLISSRYYLTTKALFRARSVVIACGFSTKMLDDSGKEQHIIDADFLPIQLKGHELIVDSELTLYEGKKYANVVNPRQCAVKKGPDSELVEENLGF